MELSVGMDEVVGMCVCKPGDFDRQARLFVDFSLNCRNEVFPKVHSASWKGPLAFVDFERAEPAQE
jgi:hypothetical protein